MSLLPSSLDGCLGGVTGRRQPRRRARASGELVGGGWWAPAAGGRWLRPAARALTLGKLRCTLLEAAGMSRPSPLSQAIADVRLLLSRVCITADGVRRRRLRSRRRFAAIARPCLALPVLPTHVIRCQSVARLVPRVGPARQQQAGAADAAKVGRDLEQGAFCHGAGHRLVFGVVHVPARGLLRPWLARPEQHEVLGICVVMRGGSFEAAIRQGRERRGDALLFLAVHPPQASQPSPAATHTPDLLRHLPVHHHDLPPAPVVVNGDQHHRALIETLTCGLGLASEQQAVHDAELIARQR